MEVGEAMKVGCAQQKDERAYHLVVVVDARVQAYRSRRPARDPGIRDIR